MLIGTSKMARTSWGLDTVPRDEWRDGAACKPHNAHLFEVVSHGRRGAFLTLSQENQTALNICATCPVRQACLDDALSRREEWTFIRGGRVVQAGQIVPARPRAANHHDMPTIEARAMAEVLPEPDNGSFTEAVADLLGLGWNPERIASALGIGAAAVRQHARQAATR